MEEQRKEESYVGRWGGKMEEGVGGGTKLDYVWVEGRARLWVGEGRNRGGLKCLREGRWLLLVEVRGRKVVDE